MAANRRRLAELGMATELAKEVASQIEGGGLQLGTTSTTALAGDTAIPVASAVAGAALAAAAAVGVSAAYARADHVHAIPGVSVGAVRGTVLIQAAQANSVAADTAAMVVDFNALLVKLRAAGVLTP